MALEDQTFSRKPLILLGTSFFLDDRGEPSYELCLHFRESERLHLGWEFHFVDMEALQGTTPRTPQEVLDSLQGWGVPIVLGRIFPPNVTPEGVKQFARLLASCERIHSTYLCSKYRYAGPKNLSTYSGEQIITALDLAAQDPEPSAFVKHLINASHY
jgi:hypothetical protein